MNLPAGTPLTVQTEIQVLECLAAIVVAQQLLTASANAIRGRLEAAFDPLDPDAILRAGRR